MDNIVKLAKVPGRTVEVAVPDTGVTVTEALRLGGFTDYEGFSIRINGEAGTLTDTVEGGDTVILAKEVKGN